MPINPDIRWKQRLTNFERSVQLLQQSLIIPNPDIITRAAIIQFFEVTMELAWKTLIDYLEAQKFIEINSPKSVIKKAFETGLIKDGHGWMDALEDRNLTVHTYDEDKARDIECAIRNSYFPLLNSLLISLKNKTHEQE